MQTNCLFTCHVCYFHGKNMTFLLKHFLIAVSLNVFLALTRTEYVTHWLIGIITMWEK